MQENGALDRDDEVTTSISYVILLTFHGKISLQFLDGSLEDTLFPSYYSDFVLAFVTQDVYFDDESAEVVISSLRLGDDHNR